MKYLAALFIVITIIANICTIYFSTCSIYINKSTELILQGHSAEEADKTIPKWVLR